MNESNRSEMGQYGGVDLYAQDVRVLEELETHLGEPIPPMQKGVFGFGFYSINNHVTHLQLVMKHLISLPKVIGNLTHLRALLLGANKLKELPASFANLTQLQILELTGNQFKELPAWLSDLTQLEVLNLGTNQLKELPASFADLTQLKTLGLGSNRFERLPDWLNNLSRLQWLHLGSNQLKEIPVSLSNLSQLTTLNVEKNEFTTLEKEIWDWISHVHTLSLSGNLFDLTAFKQVWRSLDQEVEEDATLRNFLEAIADSIFPEDQYQELVGVFTDELPQLEFYPDTTQPELTRVATKTTHDNWLGIGMSVSRAFYGTLIGAGLLRLYTTVLGTSMNHIYLTLYIGFLMGLWGTFFVVERLAKRQEQKVEERRKTFITNARENLFHDTERFEDILRRRYYLLESEMTSTRYRVWIGFASNVIITSVTTFLFAIFLIAKEPSPSTWERIYQWILNVLRPTEESAATQGITYSQLIVIITLILGIGHVLIIIDIIWRRQPQLASKGVELEQLVREYTDRREEKLQATVPVVPDQKDRSAP